MSARLSNTPSGGLSRVPYLPGLDGLRAIAVVGVMIYHANHEWLPGGYLGVEVFFVISGYLITLLLLAEHEKTGRVNLGQFWLRRARRLLPALFVMMAGVAVYITAFYPETREQARGDFLGGIFYVSNWYQIFVGQGYGAGELFVPLRHLWSLAVEEQFYLLWPLLMVLVLRRHRRNLPAVGMRFIGAAFVIAAIVGLTYRSGPVGACGGEYTNGLWTIGERCINVNEMLYLGSFSRASGLLLGAGFAMLWRPAAILRGPLRDKGRRLDVMAAIALVGLLGLMATLYLIDALVYNPWLFRGGFLLCGLLTLVIVAAVTHQHAAAGGLLGNKVFLWIGTRSYGLYLYHWPVIQIMRKQANVLQTPWEFLVAMAITVPITEASYRFVETPIRRGRLREVLAFLRREKMGLVAGMAVAATVTLAACSLAVADPHCVGAQNCAAEAAGGDDTVPSTEPSTVPADTTPGVTTSTTTTVPKVPQAFVAIGESVMLGAQSQLQRGGVFVDAKENRGPEGVKNAVIKLRDAGDLGKGSKLVVQVGTNAPLSQKELDAIMAEVPADAGPVWFMTLHADVGWIDGNNELIRALPTTYTNVQVIDWDAESANTQLCPDQIHVSCNGSGPAIFYANLVLAAFGAAAIS